jgi:hypothetical protein
LCSRSTHSVDIVVSCLVTLDRQTRSNVGEQTESPSQCQVERNMTLSNGRGKRTLQSDSVLLDRVDGFLRDSSLSVNEDWRDVDLLPVDRCL